jgi:hypothetical protein
MPTQPDPQLLIDFPLAETLGVLVADWVAAHCIVPDGWLKGDPFDMYEWQLVCTAKHYRVRPSARVGQLATAFVYRRSQVVAPQKTGKGPWAATLVAAEAVGPTVFAGWASEGDRYVCREHGCPCDFVYDYRPGDAMGMPQPTPLIQLLATSEDQVDNVYRPLQAMARADGLASLMRVGEQFIRLPNDGRIDVVTSSAQSRLGNPITFALMDETGIYTPQNKMVKVAETMRRGLAGMGGRAVETTNAWDPTEDSTAQRTSESQRPDLFRFHRLPPAKLSYRNKADRARIHRHVYRGSDHVDLDGIEAEAAELLERDPAQAERFFGNRLVQGAGSWLPDGLWDGQQRATTVADGTAVCGGFDGSDVDDWTGIRLETLDGFQFTPTYGPDARPCVWNPAEWGGRIPRSEVDAAWDELARRYRLIRVYCDPPRWQSDIEGWQQTHGAPPFVEWETYRTKQMYEALERAVTDLATGRLTHDGCPVTSLQVGNARKAAKPGDRYLLAKPSQQQKIDLAMCSVLAHEAAADAVAAGEGVEQDRRVVVFR